MDWILVYTRLDQTRETKDNFRSTVLLSELLEMSF